MFHKKSSVEGNESIKSSKASDLCLLYFWFNVVKQERNRLRFLQTFLVQTWIRFSKLLTQSVGKFNKWIFNCNALQKGSRKVFSTLQKYQKKVLILLWKEIFFWIEWKDVINFRICCKQISNTEGLSVVLFWPLIVLFLTQFLHEASSSTCPVVKQQNDEKMEWS